MISQQASFPVSRNCPYLCRCVIVPLSMNNVFLMTVFVRRCLSSGIALVVFSPACARVSLALFLERLASADVRAKVSISLILDIDLFIFSSISSQKIMYRRTNDCKATVAILLARDTRSDDNRIETPTRVLSVFARDLIDKQRAEWRALRSLC